MPASSFSNLSYVVAAFPSFALGAFSDLGFVWPDLAILLQPGMALLPQAVLTLLPGPDLALLFTQGWYFGLGQG